MNAASGSSGSNRFANRTRTGSRFGATQGGANRTDGLEPGPTAAGPLSTPVPGTPPRAPAGAPLPSPGTSGGARQERSRRPTRGGADASERPQPPRRWRERVFGAFGPARYHRTVAA